MFFPQRPFSARSLRATGSGEARNGVEKWLSAEGGVEEYMVKTMRAEVKKGAIDASNGY